MKREFLVGLGLSEETIDKVMAEHGKTVQDIQSRLNAAEENLTAKEADLSAANQTITDLQKANTDNAELQNQINEYQSKLEEAEAQRATDRKNAFIELGLTKAGVKNSKAVSALLDLDKITEDDKGWSGLDDQLAALKESDAYLFNIEQTTVPPTPPITTGGNPNSTPSGAKDAWAEVVERYK